MTTDEITHWQRPLKDGGWEFFMRAKGQTLSGTATGFSLNDLRAMFQISTGVELPDPEIKPARGHWMPRRCVFDR